MAKKKQEKRKKHFVLLGLGSIFVIVAMTFTIGKYWVEIFEKYQEKKTLEKNILYTKNHVLYII